MNKKTFGQIILLGSAWGFIECGLGAGLKACASSISGSVMTAVALFFVAVAWVAGGRTSFRPGARPGLRSTGERGQSEPSERTRGFGIERGVANVAFLIVVAIGFKMFDALLLGVPLRSGAITHPAFAFVLEGVGFLIAGALLMRWLKPSSGRGMLWGGASALLAAAAFPLVKFASGIPACVVAGSAIPTAWPYAPLAVGLSMLTVSLGFKTAEKSRTSAPRPAWQIPAAVLLSLALMTVVRAI
jgi:hypothetical protein